MTLDEAIKHAEEVAEEHTKYNIYGGFESCDKCAEEHRQLAEWLKELKEYREQELVLDKIRDAIEREADYQYAYVNADVAKGMYMAIEIIDKQTK